MFDPVRFDGDLPIWRDEAGIHADIRKVPTRLRIAEELVAQSGNGLSLSNDGRCITLRFCEGDLRYRVRGRDDLHDSLCCELSDA